MKNRTTTLRFPINELTPTGSTTECRNLRLADTTIEGIGALIPAGSFHPAVPARLIPLSRISLPDSGEALLLTTAVRTSGGLHELSILTAEGIHTVYRTSADIYCAVAEGSGWVVMTSTGHITVNCASSLTDSTATPSTTTSPDISLTAIDIGSISRPIEALTLADTDFSRTTPSLSDAAERRLTETLLSTYSALVAGAADNGAWIQPFLARYRLLDGFGATLYTSEPQLIAPTDGWQCCGLITLEGNKSGSTLSLDASTLEARLHTIGMTVHSLGAYAAKAETIEILVTPQLHPADFSAVAPYRIVRPSTDSPALTVAIPGATAAMADNSSTRARSLLTLMSRFGQTEQRIASLPASCHNLNTISNPFHHSAITETRDVAALLAKPTTTDSLAPTADSSLLRCISAPHSFTARRVSVSGDTILWADITPIAAPAAIPRLPGATLAPEDPPEWTGTIRITFADGHTLDSLIGYPMPIPTMLPPLISYPDPKAIRMEIWTDNTDTGEIHYAAVPLSPTEDGCSAAALDTHLNSSPLSPWTAGAYPVASPVGVDSLGARQPGAVISAATGSSLTALGAATVTPAEILAIHPAVRSQSSWDFTRNRFYALSPAGIFAVATGSDRSRLRSSLLDPRGISRPSHSAYTDTGVIVLTTAAQLLRISASGARTVASDVNGSSLAWDSASSRLLILRPDGLIEARSTASAAYHLIDTMPLPATLHNLDDGNPLIATSAGLRSPVSSPAATTHIRWSARIATGRIGRARLIALGLSAASFEGYITVATDSGAGRDGAATLLRLAVSGAINAPVVARLAGIIRPFVSVTIEADVSADFHLYDTHLIL